MVYSLGRIYLGVSYYAKIRRSRKNVCSVFVLAPLIENFVWRGFGGLTGGCREVS